MHNLYRITFALTVFSLLISCKKDPKITEPCKEEVPFTKDVTINITNMVENAIMQVSKDTAYTASTPKYITAENDTFSVTLFKYYISNIKLKRPNGTYYYEPESYHLINAADTANSCRFTLKNVPIDSYTGIEFIIGVDNTRNCSGAQSGALDVLNDMFWDWNQGYIFFKFEGFTGSFPSFGIHNITLHIGGFLQPNNLIRWANVPFGSTALNVTTEHTSVVYLKANLMEAFRNPNPVTFTFLNTATSIAAAKIVANNYVDMFTISAIKEE